MLFKHYACLLVLFLSFHDVSSFFLGSNRFPPLSVVAKQEDKEDHRPRIPQYMMLLYKMLATSDGHMKQQMPYNVNAVRGIYAKRFSKPSNYTMEMFYDIGYLRDRFTARRDEIHLHMKPPNASDKGIFRPFVIRLHDIHTNKLIRLFKVPAFNNGWQVLSLRGWTKRWVKDPMSNKGMRLSVTRRGKPARENPFVNFPEGKDPYLILFGDDTEDTLLTWRFLSIYPMNSVASVPTSRFDHRRRRREDSTQAQCKAVKKTVKLKGRKISEQYIIVEPQDYKMTECTKSCVSSPRSVGEKNEQTFKKFCCAPSKSRAMTFLVTEPLRQTVTVETVPDLVATGCTWLAQ